MSGYIKKMKLWIGLMFSVVAYGQLTTTSTTLSTSVNTASSTQWCLASATGVVVPNVASANGSLLLADREVAQVTGAGFSATCFKVKRGQMGSVVASHSAASTVWVGQPATSSGDSSRPFNGAFITALPTGACVAADQYTLPVLFVGSASLGGTPGTPYNCMNSEWVGTGSIYASNVLNPALFITDVISGTAGFITRRANGTQAAPSGLLSGDIFGVVGGRGYMATGYSPLSRADIQWLATENWTDSANGARIVFATTANGAAARTSRWYIDQDGGLKPFTTGAVSLGDSTHQVASASFVNCTSGASPAVCGASVVGGVAVAAAATSLVVNTTAVTAKSRIVLTMDSSLGTDLGITCNTTNIAAWVSARTAGTSFTITTASGPVTNPMCLNYTILN